MTGPSAAMTLSPPSLMDRLQQSESSAGLGLGLGAPRWRAPIRHRPCLVVSLL